MASFNRVILVGNVTRKIELQYTQAQKSVTTLGLAVNQKYKAKTGDWVDATLFCDVTLWGHTAEVAAEYLSTGSQVLIEGRLQLDSWKQNGEQRTKLKVVGERMQMLGPKPPVEDQPHPEVVELDQQTPAEF